MAQFMENQDFLWVALFLLHEEKFQKVVLFNIDKMLEIVYYLFHYDVFLVSSEFFVS